MNSPKDRQNREPLEWSEDTVIKDEKSSLAVRINRAKANDRTLFSVELGRVDVNGRFLRFFNPRVESAGSYQVNISFFDTRPYDAMLIEASERCKTVIEAERLDRKIEREERDANRDKPQMRPGLKKLGKMDR